MLTCHPIKIFYDYLTTCIKLGGIVLNSNQIKNAILLSKVLNFSQTAEQLGITQPALSKQILSLEKELGVTLFDREHTPLSLTPAGEYFITQVNDLIYREDQLIKSLSEYNSGKNGSLTIGITPFRSLYMMPELLKKIKAKYPGIKVILQEENSTTLRREALEGKYDFAIVNLPVDSSILNVTPLEPDVLVLAVPNTMLELLPEECLQCKDYMDFKYTSKLPFVVLSPNQELRNLFDGLCIASDFIPNISTEVVGITSAWAMAKAGLGATLLPLQFVNNQYQNDSFTLFKIKADYTRQPAIVTRKGQFISKHAQFAIDTLKKL